VLASNPKVNLFHTGFLACDGYKNGEQAMAAVQCPVLFAIGAYDQMTPPKAAQSLLAHAADARVVTLPVGHHQMTEAPQALLEALQDFLKTGT
jgi:pimeloyl-ACP methyl ester carboxylesterase